MGCRYQNYPSNSYRGYKLLIPYELTVYLNQNAGMQVPSCQPASLSKLIPAKETPGYWLFLTQIHNLHWGSFSGFLPACSQFGQRKKSFCFVN